MSKNRFLDSLEVKNPCSEDWDEMSGNERVRFCSHCSKNVNNLSELTRKEAMRLVRKSNGSLCVRYAKHPVTNVPIFINQLHQITRRTPVLAAGVVSASFGFSTLAYAQGGPDNFRELPDRTKAVQSTSTAPRELVRKSDNRAENSVSESIKSAFAIAELRRGIFGMIADQNGAIIVGASVTLVRIETKESRSVTSDDAGFYRFGDLEPGVYELRAESAHFTPLLIENIVIADHSVHEQEVNVALQVGSVSVVVGGMGMVEYASSLHQAIASDDLEQARNLIIHGANINLKDENYHNITPLFLAVENGHLEMVKLLLDFGAKVNARDSEKKTPLMNLDEDASAELVEILIKYGAKVNLASKDGSTALIMAAENAEYQVVEALINAGAEINAKDKEGQTALMNAAFSDDFESVRLLILAGAEVNLKNDEGETAWDLTNEDKIKHLLEMHGAIVVDDN